jgi:hypothetical protein
MAILLDIFQLSKAKGRPVRQLRTLVAARKIPCLKLGHRTMLFDPEKVDQALARFEIKEIGAKNK